MTKASIANSIIARMREKVDEWARTAIDLAKECEHKQKIINEQAQEIERLRFLVDGPQKK